MLHIHTLNMPVFPKRPASVLLSSPGASICGEDWGPKLCFSTLLFSFVYLSSPSLHSKVGPLKCSQGVRGSAVSSQKWGPGRSPSRNQILYILPQKSDI